MEGSERKVTPVEDARPAPRVKRECRDFRVKADFQEAEETTDRQAVQEIAEKTDFLDYQEESDQRVLQDSPVSTASQDRKEIPASDSQAQLVSRETRDCRAWKDPPDPKVPQEEMA